MAGCSDASRLNDRRQNTCGSLQPLSDREAQIIQNRNENIPGNLKRGYGLVAIPMAISVFSGLS